MFIPVLPEVAVHLGENFRFVDFAVNGPSRLIQFSAKAKIIPHPLPKSIISNLLILEKDKSRRESSPAIFQCDASDWITTTCQFR